MKYWMIRGLNQFVGLINENALQISLSKEHLHKILVNKICLTLLIRMSTHSCTQGSHASINSKWKSDSYFTEILYWGHISAILMDLFFKFMPRRRVYDRPKAWTLVPPSILRHRWARPCRITYSRLHLAEEKRAEV